MSRAFRHPASHEAFFTFALIIALSCPSMAVLSMKTKAHLYQEIVKIFNNWVTQALSIRTESQRPLECLQWGREGAGEGWRPGFCRKN